MGSKSVQNQLYKVTIYIGASKLTQVLWYFCQLLFFSNPFIISSGVKIFLLKIFGAKIGAGVIIKPSVKIKYPWKLSIGSHSWIGENVWIDNLSDVFIGENVCISQGAMLLTGSHDHTKITFDFMSDKITLEEGVWIGCRAVVSSGVTCRSHSMLGINSVAEANLEPFLIYKGNPAVPVIKRVIS
jgi:putative colanic acid biosynthesis acetyltransferase WcaF